ncbi:MAG: efflux RND transporter permease subunit, partial [Bacteriovoracaceae bacterium]
IESSFILPAHMKSELPYAKRAANLFRKKERVGPGLRERMVHALESKYAAFLEKVLPFRAIVIALFGALLVGSVFLFKENMKFVMFPREEARDFSIKVKAPEGVTRYEMAKMIGPLERIFLEEKFEVVTSVRSSTGQSRRGGEVRENEASIRVEILPPSERDISLNQLINAWEPQAQKIEGFEEVRFLKSRFGSDSGSAIEVQVLANNDKVRGEIADKLKVALEGYESLSNVEIEKPLRKTEYKLEIKRDLVSRLGINYSQLSGVLRSHIEGDILYTLNKEEEEVDVRFTSSDLHKDQINKVLELTVANQQGYLVPIGRLVNVVEGRKPANINRVNYKRGVTVLADLAGATKETPLDIAAKLEASVFPQLLKGHPNAELNFIGEIESSRESQSDFSLSFSIVLGLIYILLVFLFDSLVTPLLIGAIIPFGVVGVVFAFWGHGMAQFGFFAVIGTLGMIGVVINDSIVLVNKLETLDADGAVDKRSAFKSIAQITSSRLRAVVVTTLTTVAGLFPTAYGIGGFDSMLSEMMLAMGWGL